MFPGNYRSSKKIIFETLTYLGQEVSGDWEDRCDAVQPEAPLKRFWHERVEFRVAPNDGVHLVRLDFFKYSPFNLNETQRQDYYKMQVMSTWFQYCSGQPILRVFTSPPQTYNFELSGNDWLLESVTHLESVANTTHPHKVLQIGVNVSSTLGIEYRSLLPGGRRRIPTFCASMDIPSGAWSPPMLGDVPRDGDGQVDLHGPGPEWDRDSMRRQMRLDEMENDVQLVYVDRGEADDEQAGEQADDAGGEQADVARAEQGANDIDLEADSVGTDDSDRERKTFTGGRKRTRES